MSGGLRQWMERRELNACEVAAALGVSIGLLERILAGEVEPVLETATLLHVLTGGEIGIDAWPSLAGAGPELHPVAAQGVRGWQVCLLLGVSPIARLTAAQARLLAAHLTMAAAAIDCPGRVPE